MHPLPFFQHLRLLIALLCLSLIISQPLLAAQYEEERTTEEAVFLKGMIHTVSLIDQTITIQQNKGPRITILVTPGTEFKGFGKLEELSARQGVKIWYRQEQSGNIGLRIFKPMELGC